MKSIVIELCAGTACHVMGAHGLNNFLNSLSDSLREAVRVKLTHCLGNCGEGPSVRVDGKLYGRVSVEKLQEIINTHLEQE